MSGFSIQPPLGPQAWLALAAAGPSQPPRKKKNRTGLKKCYKCGIKGHLIQECPDQAEAVAATMVATDAPQSGEPELVPAAEQVGAEAVQEVVVSDDASEVEEALSRPSSVPCHMQEEGRYSGRDTQGSRQEESHLSNVTTSYTPSESQSSRSAPRYAC